jgi:DNA-binding transcriptional ArsR family regulator
MDVIGLAVVGHALSDPTRVRVLGLCDGERAVGEIAAKLNVTSATASFHIGRLREAGLVETVREGRRSVPRRLHDIGRLLIRALDRTAGPGSVA